MHYLLVSPLHRAVSLEQMDDASVMVAQKLNLDVSRSFDELQTINHSQCGGFTSSPLTFSTNRLPSPNALRASENALLNNSSTSSILSILLIPLPPPP
ncbi:hypothetical protein WR25_08846 [Diploscapter pachys]|uniref:Uncharacterized protein n=1 Tax=Diploscapter pachys TaxID=2018661 RepID=A0A2A2JAN5_9BILA|nr:hypothetical protein WR25_08846 [Diploscapter pachys]